jgi:hypothetical protein
VVPFQGGDGLENTFCAWHVVTSCPFDSLSDSQREGFEGGLGSAHGMSRSLRNGLHPYLW